MPDVSSLINTTGGGWELAGERAFWAKYGAYHKAGCQFIRPGMTEGTFEQAAKEIMRPCLSCWPDHSMALRTWVAIVRSTYRPEGEA